MGSCLCREKQGCPNEAEDQECADGEVQTISGRLIIDTHLPVTALVRPSRSSVPSSTTVDRLVLDTLSVIRTLVEK
jgi:hypothetical protein